MFFDIFGRWLRGLLALAILVCGLLLIREWVQALPHEIRLRDPLTAGETVRPVRGLDRLRVWRPGHDRATSLLIAGSALLLFAFAGRFVSPWLWRKRGAPRPGPSPHRQDSLEARSGCILHLEEFGAPEAQPVLLVHGLGCDRTQWREAVEDLAGDFRVITMDLPGHGLSGRENENVNLGSLAGDLGEVIARIGAEDLVLVGHSLGGMIAMDWAARSPGEARLLAGLVLVHTTPTNPFATMTPPRWHLAIQKPIHEPLLRLTRAIPWLVSLMQRLEYWNGSGHWQSALSAFGGSETREQLDRVARLQARLRPAACARMALAATRFDVTGRLGLFDVPALVVAAEKDPVTRSEASQMIAESIPFAGLVTLRATRHMGFMEKHREFAHTLDSFRRPGRQPVASSGGR